MKKKSRGKKIKKSVQKLHKQELQNVTTGSLLRQIILGGQDGLVNVLGVILGVAAATTSQKIVIIAGLAATFAESISMAAVAYTSSKAQKEFYVGQLEREKREIKEIPKIEKEEIKEIYRKKGFSGKELERIVTVITSNKKIWLKEMMHSELELTESEKTNPLSEAGVVGVSSLVGSFIPLLPFFFLPIMNAIIVSFFISLLALFTFGAIKARFTSTNWIKSGIELSMIGIVAALVGYALGAWLGVIL